MLSDGLVGCEFFVECVCVVFQSVRLKSHRVVGGVVFGFCELCVFFCFFCFVFFFFSVL
jgi:hypothetical protein